MTVLQNYDIVILVEKLLITLDKLRIISDTDDPNFCYVIDTYRWLLISDEIQKDQEDDDDWLDQLY